MTDNELLALEVERLVRQVQAFAGDLAQHLLGLRHPKGEAPLDRELLRLAMRWKDLEARPQPPEVALIGHKVGAVVRTRVAEVMRSR